MATFFSPCGNVKNGISVDVTLCMGRSKEFLGIHI